MFRTIHVAGRITAQGLFLRALPDGRIEISLGRSRLTGFPVSRVS